MNYLIVLHKWFGHASEGFITEEVKYKDEETATYLALCLKERHADTFTHCDYVVIPFMEQEDLPLLPRKLTWRERLTGKTNQL